MAAGGITATKAAFQAALEQFVDDVVSVNIELAVKQGLLAKQDVQELRVLPVNTFDAKSLKVGQDCYAQFMHFDGKLHIPVDVAVSTTTKEAARTIMENFPAEGERDGLGSWLAQLRDEEMPTNIAECLEKKTRPHYGVKVAVIYNSDDEQFVTIECAIDLFYITTIKDADEAE